ncbi:MAG: helix-turn-helix transcriptional regulator [Candidatus Dormibacteria bacterium]
MKLKKEFEKQDRAARLMLVMQIFAGAPHGVTAREIGDRTGRDKRTSLRDIHALEDIGVPVLQEANDTWRLMPGYVLPTIAFTQQETMAILLATRLAVQHLDYYNEFLAMALNKLASSLPKGAVRVHVGESVSQLAAKPADAERQKVFSVITTGLLDRKQIRFTYVDSKGVETERRIHPYFMEPISLMSRGTYLFGKDIDKRELRVFKLDRIKKAEVLATDAYIPDDATLQKQVADSWGVWNQGRVQTVELLFNRDVARRLTETMWHPSQVLTRQKGGAILLTLKVRGLVEITPWILSWGADVEVVGPAELRKAVAATAARMAGTYS